MRTNVRFNGWTRGVFCAAAVVALAAVKVSADTPPPQPELWPCGADGASLSCTRSAYGDTLTVTGSGPMKDYGVPGDGLCNIVPAYCEPAPWGTVKNVVIGEGVTRVGASAFAADMSPPNTGFTINVKAANPPEVGPGAFAGVLMDSAILRVPQERIDAYRAADVWKGFGYINPHTVRFYSHPACNVNCDIKPPQLVSYGGKATDPGAPDGSGELTFAGWYGHSAVFPVPPPMWDFAADEVTHDVTLFPYWTDNTSVSHPRAPASALPRVRHRGRTLLVSGGGTAPYSLRVLDVRGKTVLRREVSAGGSVPLEKIPAGRYIVDLRTASGAKLGMSAVTLR